MKIIAVLSVLAAVSMAAQVPYVPLFAQQCGDREGPWPLFNAVEDAGMVSHNDYLAPQETGSVYHHYSMNHPEYTVSMGYGTPTSGPAPLIVGGTAFGGAPGSTTNLIFVCINATQPGNSGPILARDCSGVYTHGNTSITTEITGKANDHGHELVVSLDGDGHYFGQAWYSFSPDFDAEATAYGDFMFRVGCSDPSGPYCGNEDVEGIRGETCDPPGEGCRADCTYCGDTFVNGDEECDDDSESCVDCRIVVVPNVPEADCAGDFDVALIDQFSVTYVAENGNADGGFYGRGSFWNDWAPRSIVDPSVVTFTDEYVKLEATLANGDDLCALEYECLEVSSVAAELVEYKDCMGSISCGNEIIPLFGKAQTDGGSELDCVSKWGSPFKCIGWTEWTVGDHTAHGDVVFTPTCPTPVQIP